MKGFLAEREAQWQELFYGCDPDHAFTVHHVHRGLWPELVKYLPACAARGGRRIVVGDNHDFVERAVTSGRHGLNGGLFGAAPKAVRGIFDVCTLVDGTRIAPKGGTYPVGGVGNVRILPHGPRGV